MGNAPTAIRDDQTVLAMRFCPQIGRVSVENELPH